MVQNLTKCSRLDDNLHKIAGRHISNSTFSNCTMPHCFYAHWLALFVQGDGGKRHATAQTGSLHETAQGSSSGVTTELQLKVESLAVAAAAAAGRNAAGQAPSASLTSAAPVVAPQVHGLLHACWSTALSAATCLHKSCACVSYR